MNTLPIALSCPSKHSRKAQRLVAYAKELDGTEITVIPVSDESDAAFIAANPANTFFKLQNQTLRNEALHFKGQAFIHLEVDSIPIKKGWASALTEEYHRFGKPYLLSSDSQPPGDLVGGIGVYGPDTSWMIPVQIEEAAWDGWMLKHIRDLIAFSPLVQHSYGLYRPGSMDKERDWRFPDDASILRPDAVIFHRDARQTLIPGGHGLLRYAHSGCMGDAIAALPTIRSLGGGHLVMTQKENKRILRGERYEFLRPLLEVQPYLSGVSWEEEPGDIDYDFTKFREIYKGDVSLAYTQSKYLGYDLDATPWLTAPPEPRTKGKIVVARSPRYQNYGFPWRRIARHYINRLVFVGLDEERKALESRIGAFLPHFPVKNALELASLIAGADCFIGNQSSPFWIAAGLGKKLLQERYQPNPDSTIVRKNAFYWDDEIHSRAALEFIRS